MRFKNFKTPVDDEDKEYPIIKTQGKNFSNGYSRMKENPKKIIHKSRYIFGQDSLREMSLLEVPILILHDPPFPLKSEYPFKVDREISKTLSNPGPRRGQLTKFVLIQDKPRDRPGLQG